MRMVGWVALAALAATLGFPGLAAPEDFYKDKTLTITVGFPPGGGFDANARLLARYIGRHIPGAPAVIVVNAPGAGSLTSVLRLDVNLPTDGTIIDIFNFGLINAALLRPAETKIDFRNYAWIGSISEDVTTCYLWRDHGPRTIAEMKAAGHFLFGAAGSGTSDDINTKILRRVFGVDLAEVYGYNGSADIRLAVERGEVDGDCGTWSSIPQDWLPNPKFHPLLRTGRNLPDGMPPDVPYVLDIAPDDTARKLIGFLIADGDLGRPFIASHAVPAERVRILRDAFTAAVTDKDFVAEAKGLRLPVSPRTGEQAEKIIKSLYETPADIGDAARKIAAD